jgi:hypothetical protein
MLYACYLLYHPGQYIMVQLYLKPPEMPRLCLAFSVEVIRMLRQLQAVQNMEKQHFEAYGITVAVSSNYHSNTGFVGAILGSLLLCGYM